MAMKKKRNSGANTNRAFLFVSKYRIKSFLSAQFSYSLILFIVIAISSCSNSGTDKTRLATEYPDSLKLFKQLDSSVTGIDFSNNIVEDQYMNPIVYEYTYNGGGVAIGDVNNDGLDDIFFTANQKSDRLYLNKGNFKFEDITACQRYRRQPGCWKTGVTMADVNGDGLLDIYVCYSGDLPGDKRINELLINKGVNKCRYPGISG